MRRCDSRPAGSPGGWSGGFLLLCGLFATLCLGSSAQAGSLQARIDAAAPGATLEVEAGEYAPILIEKPLTLLGRGLPQISGTGTGKVVRITADGVTLRGFRISGSGLRLPEDDAAIHITANSAVIEGNEISESLHGIYLKRVRDCRITGNRITGKSQLDAGEPVTAQIRADGAEVCREDLNQNRRGNGIHLFNSEGILIEGNELSDTRDGIYFSFSSNSVVRDNRIRRARYGLHYMYSDYNTFERNHFEESGAGAAMMFSKGLLVRDNVFASNPGHRSYGLLLSAVDGTRIEENRFQGNRTGVYLENSNGNLFTSNRVERNYIGVRMSSSSDGNRFSRNLFAGNLHPAELGGRLNPSNQWAVAGVGNRWSGAAPVDLDGDGVGELPHREADLLGSLRRVFPLAGLLSGSPGIELLRFAHQRATVPGMPAITDPRPLSPAFGGHPRGGPDGTLTQMTR